MYLSKLDRKINKGFGLLKETLKKGGVNEFGQKVECRQ